jgi:hypothetical protein
MALDKLYISVNRALNETLLTGRYEGRPLYLSLESAVRAEIADALSVGVEDVDSMIAQAVANNLALNGDPYQEHLEIARRWWKLGKQSPPPFTALLVALSLAANNMAADGDFGGGNYYDRLGELLQFPAEGLRFHGSSTLSLWTMFNRWLAQNDYELGKPTARQFNTRKYVNYPQSQAIVRAGDRHYLHDMFEKYGFSGGDEMSTEEMRRYLDNWIHSSASHPRLAAAWAKPELRSRVCEVALDELREWSATGSRHAEGSGGGSARLVAIASLVPQFPKARLALLLGRKGEAGASNRRLVTDENDFLGHLSNDVYGGFATVTPNPFSARAGVLEKGIELFDQAESQRLAWLPRLVIPFSQSPDGPYWIESNRVGLGTAHLVLARDAPALRTKLSEYLAETSDGQAQLAAPGSIAGLPAGWLLFNQVRIIKAVDHCEYGLDPLLPLAGAGEVQLEGGLQLTSGVWHAKAPPSVNFLATKNVPRLTVNHLGGNEPIVIANGSGPSATLKSSELSGLGDGEYTVAASAGVTHKRLAEATMVLRSAARPRPMQRQEGEGLVFKNVVYAQNNVQALPDTFVRGLEVRIGSQVTKLPVDGFEDFRIPGGELETPELDVASSAHPENISQTCVARGYHHYIVETVPPGSPKSIPVRMECKDCHLSVLARGKKTASRPKYSRKKKADKDRPRMTWKSLVVERAPDVDHDVFFDALCFLGSGSLGRLERLLGDSLSEPWQVGAIATDYSSLALLDLELEPGSGRIKRWVVPPATVCFLTTSTAFLTGFRNDELLGWVSDAVEASGGRVQRRDLASRPIHFTLEGLDHVQLKRALDGIVDPLGRPVGIVADGSMKLAKACLLLDGVGSVLRPISVGRQGRIQAFSAATARWGDAEQSETPGAYRLDFGGTTYFYRDADGTTVRGPHQVVKLLAARAQKQMLHSYDRSRLAFLSTLGVEPQGLLARALVCASGQLPVREDGATKYRGVPTAVANHVLHALYRAPL